MIFSENRCSLFRIMRWPRLHAVAFEHPSARAAEPCSVLLQAGLNRIVVSKILPAEPRRIAGAGTLLLRRAGMLREGERDIGNQKHQRKSERLHHTPHMGREATMTGRRASLADFCSTNARALTSITTAKAKVSTAVASWFASLIRVTGVLVFREKNPRGHANVPEDLAAGFKQLNRFARPGNAGRTAGWERCHGEIRHPRGVICNSSSAIRCRTRGSCSPVFAVRRIDSASRLTWVDETGYGSVAIEASSASVIASTISGTKVASEKSFIASPDDGRQATNLASDASRVPVACSGFLDRRENFQRTLWFRRNCAR